MVQALQNFLMPLLEELALWELVYDSCWNWYQRLLETKDSLGLLVLAMPGHEDFATWITEQCFCLSWTSQCPK